MTKVAGKAASRAAANAAARARTPRPSGGPSRGTKAAGAQGVNFEHGTRRATSGGAKSERVKVTSAKTARAAGRGVPGDHTAPTVALHHGDCLSVLPTLAPKQFHFCCIDPPFNTGARKRSARSGQELGYADSFGSLDAYIAWFRPRLQAMHRVLRDDGTVLVHCDWHTSHRVRVVLDEVFGEKRFLNHLVWQYGLGGSSPRCFARKHDDLLWYAKGSAWWFNAPRVPATSQRLKGKTKKATDVIRASACSDEPSAYGERMHDHVPRGGATAAQTADVLRVSASNAVANESAADVLDIASINNMAKERVGWPTQKPLALLELLVGACCPPGGAVLDCFCGSGTTLVAAQRLGRSAVGIDRDDRALSLARQRLNS